VNSITQKRRVLVTGASRGIGRACALQLAKQGFQIGVHYNSRNDLAEEVTEEINGNGGTAVTLKFDVADRQASYESLTKDTMSNGAFYGVVCNAGIAQDNAFPAMSGDEWDSVIHTNLDAFYNVLHPLIMPMIKLREGGRILTIASVSGIIGNRGQTNYSAAKAGIIGATKALAIELAKRKITVNCVAPGIIETDMTEEVFVEEAMKMIPMRRFGHVDDIAALANFLMSDDAGYITRQVISVNGGMC
tara:strand:+ start:11911 stop:12651 length:741 start_codon:yes stop_codon:yes gene_type:complete